MPHQSSKIKRYSMVSECLLNAFIREAIECIGDIQGYRQHPFISCYSLLCNVLEAQQCTRALCPSVIDRGKLCFRCGKEGHKAITCKAEPRCMVCAEARRPAGHVMGARSCNPPASKGKVVSVPRSTPLTTRSYATETVAMSDQYV